MSQSFINNPFLQAQIHQNTLTATQSINEYANYAYLNMTHRIKQTRFSYYYWIYSYRILWEQLIEFQSQ